MNESIVVLGIGVVLTRPAFEHGQGNDMLRRTCRRARPMASQQLRRCLGVSLMNRHMEATRSMSWSRRLCQQRRTIVPETLRTLGLSFGGLGSSYTAALCFPTRQG